MSYGRNPHYIYPTDTGVWFAGTEVGDDLINAFLYKILLTYRRDELAERLRKGREEWLHQRRVWGDWKGVIEEGRWPEMEEEIPQDDPAMIEYREWMDKGEDEIMKMLMGVSPCP
jgi:hypothetical protein